MGHKLSWRRAFSFSCWLSPWAGRFKKKVSPKLRKKLKKSGARMVRKSLTKDGRVSVPATKISVHHAGNIQCDASLAKDRRTYVEELLPLPTSLWTAGVEVSF